MAKFSTTGLVSGAASGASLGSAFGPIGSGIGAITGGALGGLFGNSGAKKDKIKQTPAMSPQQQQLLNQILGQTQGMGGGGYQSAIGLLQNYLNPESGQYKSFKDPYMRHFNEQIVPRLAERFAGMGANSGALGSSGFAQALGGAGAGLEENLAQLQAQMQLGSAGSLINQYNSLLNTGLGARPYNFHTQAGQASPFGSALQGFAGQITPGNLQSIMSGFGSLFQGSQNPGGMQMGMSNLMGNI